MQDDLALLTQRTVDTIEHLQETADQSLQRMLVANRLLCDTFLNEGKVLVCGSGPSAATAQLLCSYLLHRYDLDRPALPAINLSNNSALISQIGVESSINDIFAKPIQALAQSQDLLVVFNHGTRAGSLVQAIQAAHNRGLRVLAFSCRIGEDVVSLLTPEDLEIATPGSGSSAVEAHTMLVHRLCELVDRSIFGSEDVSS
ncbi:MAG: SIS domain-containing protein [Natronospirillum sp.]|uniref:D-sedoheptulose-7-phosphate isomerase n=1 Tax=Natronospirillum sp. TaxID=2812955 RepID=UPI0025F70B6E|nr:SIS domain-containing protein [Natronospirillum sp.]MCH8551322.1 SIS domain-containing protein [Natronospirillum sp.]